jgi:hypothetical protein
MFIPDATKNRILEVSEGKLIEVISDFTNLHKSGSEFVGECPCCKADRSLNVSVAKGIFKCFRCNELAGKRPVDYLMKGQGKSFPDALRWLADKFGVIIEEPPAPAVKKTVLSGKKTKGGKYSFATRMLTESGLTDDDIRAHIYRNEDKKSLFQVRPIRSGTVNSKGEIVDGDDAVIEYYDLDGFPCRYEVKDARGRMSGVFREYFRVRWQFPEEHLDKNGNPYKYRSPSGSHSFIYIPEKIRAAVKAHTPIERLYIQEGEKKAEKASKHGLPSIGISGIQNLGYNQRLPEDVITIIATCQVKEVCFLLDSDWDDLSHSLRVDDNLQRRPYSFFSAVRNYKDYMRTLRNRNIYVEIYFGYVLKNEAHEKGIDDLLAGSLAGHETDLVADIDFLINEKNLTGKYLQLHKITTCNDHKLEELWALHNPRAFAERHIDALRDLPEFLIGRHRWRINDKGELESAQPVESDEMFWTERTKSDRSGNEYSVFEYKYDRSFRFLRNRGFGRFRRIDGTYQFVHLEPPVVRTVEHWEVRDYLIEFAKVNCKEDVIEMLYRGGTQYLGPDKLSYMEFVNTNFLPAVRDRQIFYFAEKCWEITDRAIKEVEYSSISHHIWSEQRKALPAKLLRPLFTVKNNPSGEGYKVEVGADGRRCHFLQFLINTSNFTWHKEKLSETNPSIVIDEIEIRENMEHLVSKLCAIGYLMMEHKDRSTSKAVIAMDGLKSEVGASNGRSGKSLVGELFKNIMSTIYINGKKSDLSTDTFLWDELTEKTRAVFIDDVRPGFDFESLFANITGDWAVNYKGGRRCTFPFSSSPKIYITTNHAISGEGTSFRDRQWLIAFSDFYNDNHKPIDDFGALFFDEWDFEQWNLTWNMLALCVQLYLRLGVVQSPKERLEQRQMRQFIGEEFLSWAEEYFSNPDRRNKPIPRKDLFDAFLLYAPDQRKWCKPTLFKKKIIRYCNFRGYRFNPHRYDKITGQPMFFDRDGKPDIDDKSGGIEYFTIGDIDKNQPVDELNVKLSEEDDRPFPDDKPF